MLNCLRPASRPNLKGAALRSLDSWLSYCFELDCHRPGLSCLHQTRLESRGRGRAHFRYFVLEKSSSGLLLHIVVRRWPTAAARRFFFLRAFACPCPEPVANISNTRAGIRVVLLISLSDFWRGLAGSLRAFLHVSREMKADSDKLWIFFVSIFR